MSSYAVPGLLLSAAVATSSLVAIAAPSAPLAATEDSSADLELERSRQLVVVITDDWSAVSGEMRCFERRRSTDGWAEVLPTAEVVLGRNGLAWGLGLHSTRERPGPAKQEGDGRAPAGAFRLVEAFGFATVAEARISGLPYRHLTDTLEGVDDPRSRHYNRLVDAESLSRRDWQSSERMRHVGERYRWGVVVAHNWNQVPGRGSCIFLHIWEGPKEGTAGCTAMPSAQMLKVIRWLERKKNPVLVQLPRSEYERLRAGWRLP